MDVQWAAVFADVAAPEFDRAAAFWTAVCGGELGAASGESGEWVPVVRSGEDSSVWLQRTGREAGEAGWHLDLFAPDPIPAVARAEQLGAKVQRVADHVTALTTPAGQAFCLVRDDSRSRTPEPVAWPDGHRSLVDQVCLDIPAQSYDTEAQFWAGLTGWERRSGEHEEFELLVRPVGVPLRILLQRMDEPEPIRAHVDLSCSDVPAEVARHESLGASVARVTDGWTTLHDPIGLPYCVTRRVPGR